MRNHTKQCTPCALNPFVMPQRVVALQYNTQVCRHLLPFIPGDPFEGDVCRLWHVLVEVPNTHSTSCGMDSTCRSTAVCRAG
jgi:hypothetical protein